MTVILCHIFKCFWYLAIFLNWTVHWTPWVFQVPDIHICYIGKEKEKQFEFGKAIEQKIGWLRNWQLKL